MLAKIPIAEDDSGGPWRRPLDTLQRVVLCHSTVVITKENSHP